MPTRRIYPLLSSILVLIFAAAACQLSGAPPAPPSQPPAAASDASAPPASPSPTSLPPSPTATALPPTFTPTSPPPTQTPVPTATLVPTVEIPTYAEFPHAETLPDDAFTSQAPLPFPGREQVIPFNLDFSGPCADPGTSEKKAPGFYFQANSLTLCDDANEQQARPVTIHLTRPDGSQVELQRSIQPGVQVCVDHTETLARGNYALQVSSGSLSADGSFPIGYAYPQVFTRGDEVFNGAYDVCAGFWQPGQPLLLFFAGFDPNTEYSVMAYVGNLGSGMLPEPFTYQTSWKLAADDKGRLLQIIEHPQFPADKAIVLLIDNQAEYNARGMKDAPLVQNSTGHFAILPPPAP